MHWHVGPRPAWCTPTSHFVGRQGELCGKHQPPGDDESVWILVQQPYFQVGKVRPGGMTSGHGRGVLEGLPGTVGLTGQGDAWTGYWGSECLGQLVLWRRPGKGHDGATDWSEPCWEVARPGPWGSRCGTREGQDSGGSARRLGG